MFELVNNNNNNKISLLRYIIRCLILNPLVMQNERLILILNLNKTISNFLNWFIYSFQKVI